MEKLELNQPSTESRGGSVNKNFVRVIKGSLFAIIISLILLLIYASLLTYTDISENTMPAVVITISGISILIASSISSMKIKKQGMLNGALVGLIYMVFIYILSSILISGFSLDTKSIIMILVGMLAGMVGGIIGVNL